MQKNGCFVLVLLTVAIFGCNKKSDDPDDPGWISFKAYTTQLAGDCVREWKQTFMRTYIQTNYKQDTSWFTRSFTPQHYMKFYRDGKVETGDSIRSITHLPAAATWKPLHAEPFSEFAIDSQEWTYVRYYPVPKFEKEQMILYVKYELGNGNSIGYDMTFEVVDKSTSQNPK